MTRAQIRRLLAAVDAGALRTRAGITLQTVATALGTKPQVIWQWENGGSVPTGAKGAAYARFIAGLARHEAVRAGEWRRAA